MQVQFSDVVFAYDFDRLTAGGLLYDHGPYELHATPGAGAAAPTRQLDGSYSLDGGDYWQLSGTVQTRFYSVVPTGAHTWLAVFTPTSEAVLYIFSCWDTGGGGANDGNAILWVNSPSYRVQIYQWQGTGVNPQVVFGGPRITLGRKTSTICTIETTPRALVEQSAAAAAPVWAAGAFGVGTFDATIVPRIGMNPNGAGGFVGRLYYLALLRGSLASSDLAELSALMSQERWPWCYR